MASIKRILPFLVVMGLAAGCSAGWLNPTQQGFVIQTFTTYDPITGNNTGTISTNGNSFQFAGDNTGQMYLGGPGVQFRGKSDGQVFVDGNGGLVMGAFGALSVVTNRGWGSLLLGNLAVGQKAVITDVGNASILLGAGVVSNSQAIVVGDGNVSHGLRSVTADSFWGMGSGFHGDGSGLTGITAAQVGAATAAQGARADAAGYTPDYLFGFDGVGTITSYTGTFSEVRIPLTIGGVAVTNIGPYAFQYNTTMQRLTLSDVVCLGVSAFDTCSSLTYVDASNLLRIGVGAFVDCDVLVSIRLPKVEVIGDYAFNACDNLVGIYFSGNAPVLGTEPIGCTAYYLAGRTGYDSWGWSQTNTWVETDNIFSFTVNGTPLDSNGNVRVTSAQVTYTPEAEFGFDGAGKITSYSGTNAELRIPPTIGGVPVTEIGMFAFEGKASIVRLFLPASVKTVGPYTFDECSELTAADMPGATYIGHSAFKNCYKLASASMPNVVYIEDNAFISCFGLTAVSLPSVQTIGSGAYSFYNCTNLVTVSMPVVTSIAAHTFLGCTKLASVYFSGNAPALGSYVDPFTGSTISGVFEGTAPAIAYYPQGRTGYNTWGYTNTNTWVQTDNIYSLAVNGVVPDANGNISLGAVWKTNVWWAYATSNALQRTAYTNIYLGK